MSRQFSEASAEERRCPFMSSHSCAENAWCIGSACMCWVWTIKPVTETLVYFGWPVDEQPLQEQSAIRKPPMEVFREPDGEGWAPSVEGPKFNENFKVWVLKFVRSKDHESLGRCGLVGGTL